MTTSGGQEWERYDLWNEAIAAVVYAPTMAGRAVYLDLEDDVLVKIRDHVDPAIEDPTVALLGVVRETLQLDGSPTDVFRSHLTRLDTWYADGVPVQPPVLALLAVLSLAAEEMHDGEGMAANNYYGRMNDLLGLTQEQLDSFTSGYRRRRRGAYVSEYLWTSLNDWLELLEGARGLPTAAAADSGHTHIGLPLSQALVRATDREGFADMFATYGLSPHQSVPPSEMAVIIDEWASRIPCPLSNSLERAWNSGAARARVAETACQTLEDWDGSARAKLNSTSRLFDTVRLRANLRRFPSSSLELGLLIPSQSRDDETLQLMNDGGSSGAELSFSRSGEAWLALQDAHQLDYPSFLTREISLGGRIGAPLKRRPRRVVPLRTEERLATLVECERVQLGQRAAILVHSDMVTSVSEFLSRYARPGWVHHEDLAGLPAEWSYFSDVEVHVPVPYEEAKVLHLDLMAIQPTSASHAALSGGLKLPGHIAKWASGRAPEFVASVDGAKSMRARLECVRSWVRPIPLEGTVDSAGYVLIWDLASLHLPDGDYRLTYAGDDDEKGVVSLRLRSADRPAVHSGMNEASPAHWGEASGFGLLACTRSPPDFEVAPVNSLAPNTLGESRTVGWYGNRKASPRRPAAAQILAPGTGIHTCMSSGAHYTQIETWAKGMTSMEGVCRDCGLVKRFPASARRKRGARAEEPATPAFDASTLAPVRREDSELLPWSLLFDAICHVGYGPRAHLERIAQQADGSALYVDDLFRRLEALGHMNVLRDPLSMRVERWNVTPPTLIGLPTGDYLACGFRSESMLVALEDAAYALDLDVVTNEDVAAPPQVRITGMDEELARLIAADVSVATERDVEVLPKAARSLASTLPPLGSALRGLRTIPMMGAPTFEHWDPTIARFKECTGASTPGAYRLSGFRRAYIYRRPGDIERGEALVGDARIVKYAAALWSGQPLAGYDVDAEVLYAPLGADLPGLYGRAAVLATGRPPMDTEDERILQYDHVPPDVGAHICKMMMSKEDE